MNKALVGILMAAPLAGCAFRGDVQRMGVDFNSTVANTANELTLLNVLRAKENHPLHFSSYSLVRGNIQFTSGASLNGALKGSQSTRNTDVLGNVSSAIVDGVDVFTPNVSAQVVTGPSFDIAIHDTQEFYQGILTSVPAETIAHYLYQGWSSEFVSYLLVQRVNFRARETFTAMRADGPATYNKGDVVHSIETSPHLPSAREFEEFVACYELSAITEERPPVPLAPASRLKDIEVADLALLDGKTFDLSKAMTADPAADTSAMVRRLRPSRERLRLFLREGKDAAACEAGVGFRTASGIDAPSAAADDGHTPVAVTSGVLAIRPDSVTGKRMQFTQAVNAKVDVEFVFRSVEGIFTFLGDYLRTTDDGSTPYQIEGGPIFDVTENGREGMPLVSARLNGRRYFIVQDRDERYRISMRVITLLQQLINLQKKSADKPTTQAVRVID